MAGFNAMDYFNKSQKAAQDEPPRGRFRSKDIRLDNIYINSKNFYPQEEVEEKAAEIYAIGLLENLVVVYAPENGKEYKLISGERRFRALNLLVEQGNKEFEVVTCNVRSIKNEYEEIVELIIANSSRTKTGALLLEEEKQLKTALEKMKEQKIPLKGYDLQSGRLRDVIAKILNKSTSKIAQIEAINNNLTEELKEEVKNGHIGFSAAYELSKLDADQQAEEYKRITELNGTVTVAAVKEVLDSNTKEEEDTEPEEEIESVLESNTEDNTEEEYQEEEEQEIDANPKTAKCLCYSCKNWDRCDKKGSDVVDCNAYINKLEFYKTDEEKYNEEQDKIDSQTKQKLQELEDAARMEELPGDKEVESQKVVITKKSYKEIEEEEKHILLLPNPERYNPGIMLVMLEYSNGQATGRKLQRTIKNVIKDVTGVEDGYCVVEIGRKGEEPCNR